MSAERPPEPALKGETEDDLLTRFPPEGASEDDLLTRFNRGGSLIVARAESLQWLQAECLRADAVVPTVLTARYRLHTGPVFGNLMAAFAADVAAMRRGEPQRVRGDLLPDPMSDTRAPDRGAVEDGSPWARFLSAQAWQRLEFIGAGGPALNRDWVVAFIGALRDGEALPRHRRLLLFCEVEAEPGDAAEWHSAVGALLAPDALPENVTIVVSDAPPGWRGRRERRRTSELELPPSPVDREEIITFGEAALSGDQPADVDHLGMMPLATGLARLLLLPQTRPLTVGLQAPWGWGKSSFAGFVRAALVRTAPGNVGAQDVIALEAIDDELAGPARSTETDAEIADARRARIADRVEVLARLERAAERDVISVAFNAWRYEGSEQVWAGLARTITERLEGTLSFRARWWSRVVYAISRRPLQFWGGFVTPVILALVAVSIAVLLGLTDAGDELSRSSGWIEGLVALGAVAVIFWRLFQVLQPVSAQVAGYVQGPDYAAHVGYQNEVIEDLKFLRGRLPGRSAKAAGRRRRRSPKIEPRIIVFVDDLDRCSDESIMETLQAINLVLGQSDFFVVLAIDQDMIHRAIARQRGLSDDDEAAAAFAENYLRKIIQLPLHLPHRTAEQRFGFVTQLFTPTAQREYAAARAEADGSAVEEAPPPAPARAAERDGERSAFAFDPSAVVAPRVRVLREVQDTSDELGALDDFRAFLEDNPRELKRLVNVHRLVKILLLRPDVPPTVAEQRRLVAWLVFCARWPDLVDDVLRCAADQPHEDDCVNKVHATQGDAELTRFTKLLEGDPAKNKEPYRMSGQDLVAGGTLERAARISRLVRDSPAATRPQPAAASDPATPPAASPS